MTAGTVPKLARGRPKVLKTAVSGAERGPRLPRGATPEAAPATPHETTGETTGMPPGGTRRRT